MEIAERYNPKSKITLFQGDCMDFLRELPESSAQLVVTSPPPYNIGKSYEKKLPIENYMAQQKEVIEECVRILKPDGSICWEIGNHVNKGEIFPIDIERLKRHFPAVPVKVILVDADEE